ncbi:hemerythrin domain-containing protein [Thermomonospora umbrina]|uniref:Hemerythrin HHE cation binding domain-containing protein n=1 Tax=Thermomonospora umbrina TaxID=111806 RepID=A0A3D9SV37_9ACTN|nr:hemerythrin domain-containing protein [Thermomonospora umbrina]REE99829.1 hemerythrin HHE cation binding domain-containing protein [Thermomonospora umbrina]
MIAETDVVDLLQRQHEEIRGLFSQVLESTGRERRDAFRRLVRLLAVHETAEEEIVHPLVRRTGSDGERIVEERLREEREAKVLLSTMEGLDVDEPAFLRGLTELREAVLGHANAEERLEFPLVRDAFGEPERRALALAVRTAEATAPTHPHPGTESARRNLLTGPAVAVADRTRDLVSGAMARVGR